MLKDDVAFKYADNEDVLKKLAGLTFTIKMRRNGHQSKRAGTHKKGKGARGAAHRTDDPCHMLAGHLGCDHHRSP